MRTRVVMFVTGALRRVVAVAAPAFVVACALSAALPSPAHALRFGAWTPGDPYNGTLHGADALQQATGRRVEIVNWYQSWGGEDWVAAVQRAAIDAVIAAGRAPMITWEPWTPGRGAQQPRFSLSSILLLEHDDYIQQWARALKEVDGTVYLRPMHEMNGDWYPWGGTVNDNTPQLFVRAWQHIVNTFRAEGAGNVRFVWSPMNVDVPASNKMEDYYPGGSYVDVLAMDAYNWGSDDPQFGGWQTFNEIVKPAYDRLRALGTQPIWLAELATSDIGGDKAAWIRDAFEQAAKLSRLHAVVWFNENKERDWRAAPTAKIAAAFKPRTTGDAATRARTAGADSAHGGAAATRARGKLTLILGRTARVGGRASLRWTSTAKIARWTVTFNGRSVASRARKGQRVARARITVAGRQRWTVVGRDASGRTVVTASRSFTAKR